MEEFRELLQETHDSTIRQETILENVQRDLADGKAIFKNHEKRLQDVEAFRDGINSSKKIWNKIAMVALTAISFPAAAAGWTKFIAWLKS